MYLIDTNVYIIYVTQARPLPKKLERLLRQAQVPLFMSAVVPWEISIKHAIGKLPAGATLLPSYEQTLHNLGIQEVPVTGKHAIQAGQLPPIHSDPFDRMMIAQAQLESLMILTLDSLFNRYSVSVLTG